MRRPTLVAALLCVTGLLAACQGGLGTPAAGTDVGVTPNAVAGSPIEVTALSAPSAPGGAAGETGAKVTADPASATGPAATAKAEPQAAPEEAAPAEAAATPAPKPDVEAAPVTPKSEMQLACEKKGGRWYKIGEGEKRACVRQTRDGGKGCDRESQCEGVCLARSGTCSPFKPMYGCNEIFQDNGARVTLCLD